MEKRFDTEFMIDARGVTKRYGKFIANNNVDIGVRAGELAVLAGPNGAGKSTIIKSICGLLRITGHITIDGYPNRTSEARARLSYAPEMPALYPMLTVSEHLEFIARAYKLDESWRQTAENLMTRFELIDKKDKLGKELSKGMQQKVSLCCALLTKPKAIILDEPLVGLDPHAIRELRSIINEIKEAGTAILISTHMIECMEANWDVVYIMVNSKVEAVVRRNSLPEGETLEDIFFKITEPDRVAEGEV